MFPESPYQVHLTGLSEGMTPAQINAWAESFYRNHPLLVAKILAEAISQTYKRRHDLIYIPHSFPLPPTVIHVHHTVVHHYPTKFNTNTLDRDLLDFI